MAKPNPNTIPPIWILTYEASVYDAYGGAYICWWPEKPTIETVAFAIGKKFPAEDDAITLNLVRLWAGEAVSLNEGEYLLAQYEAGA